ncbi:MAG: c-type cytochrome [Gammaproteobacteria bacterium]|nr:c-type cytochrome [Gammaproteobacteria bacterium]
MHAARTRGCVIKKLQKLLLSSFLTIAAGLALAADVDGLVETCDGCHGAGGVSEWSDMPTIAGIDAFVHSEALYTYLDGARPCAESAFRRGDTSRQATNMCDIAAGLSEDDIEAIAAHYAGLSFAPAKQAFDADLAAVGEAIHESECSVCHSDGGSNPADESSILAGQWTGYLRATFEHYLNDERDQPERMQRAIQGLSAEDVNALLNYYASQQ